MSSVLFGNSIKLHDFINYEIKYLSPNVKICIVNCGVSALYKYLHSKGHQNYEPYGYNHTKVTCVTEKCKTEFKHHDM